MEIEKGVEEFYEIKELGRKGSSFSSSLFNLMNTLLGGGILALPQAFAFSGLAVGAFFTLLVGCMSTLGSSLLAEAADIAGGVRTYKDLSFIAFGTFGAFIIDICLILSSFGVMTGFIVIIADLLTPYIALLFDLEDDPDSDGVANVKDLYRNLVSVVVVVVVLIPISLLPRIDFLKYSSSAAMLCILYMVIIISILSIKDISEDFNEDEIVWANFGIEFFSAMPVIIFSFSFHTNLFPIREEMSHPEKIDQVAILACSIAGVLYITVGIFGYLTFLQCVESNILVNFNESVSITVAKVSLVIVICFSYPLLNFACRLSVVNMLFPEKQEPSCWDWWPAAVRKWKGREETLTDNSMDSLFLNTTASTFSSTFPTSFSQTSSSSPSSPSSLSLPTLEKVSLPIFIFITITISLLALLLSIFVPDIQAIFGLVGATAASVVVFVAPGAIYLRLDQSSSFYWKRLAAWFVLVVGIGAMGVGMFTSIYNWGKSVGGGEDCI